MNLKTTLVLLVLIAAVGGLAWYGQLPPALDPSPASPPLADRGTREALNELKPEDITHLRLRNASGEIVLDRKADNTWTMPGNWPPRKAEAEELTRLLGHLHSRFEPVPIGPDTDLKPYRLDHPPVTVRLETEKRKYLLSFGEQRDAADSTPFTRETYLRLDDRTELVRLAPGLLALLDRPIEYYQRHRLFPADRVVKEGSETKEKEEKLAAQSIEVRETKKDGLHFSVARKDGEWELSDPVRDRLDEPSRAALLAAIPDIWAEQFLKTGPTAVAASLAALTTNGLNSLASATFWLTPQGMLVKSGLTHPERALTVIKPNGDPVTLLIGNVSTTHGKQVQRPQPPGMFPQREPAFDTVYEEYHFARLKDNEQIFEIRGDKLKSVFVKLDALRDAHVAPFNSADARRVEIKHGGEDIVLEKDKDNWKLTKPLAAEADNTKVSELLNKLSGLQARDKDILDKEDPKKFGLDKPAAVVVVTVEEESKDAAKSDKDKKEKKKRTLTVRLGKHDTEKKKLYVMAGDWPRINVVEDSLEPLVTRSALAYRGKRLFDFNAADVAKIAIENQGKKFALDHDKDKSVWRLSSPVKADTDLLKVEQMVNDLGKLEAVEYVNQTPKKDELEAQYGLGKPSLVVRVEFLDKKKPAQVLHVGKARGGKGGYFAQFSGATGKPAPVFAINADIQKELTHDSLSYRPLRLWQIPPAEVASLRFRKEGQKEYSLTRSGEKWKIDGPFEANALAVAARKLATDFGSPKIESYKTHEAKNLAEYGLDKPALSVTVKAEGGTEHTLLLGKPTADGAASRYAKTAKDTAIFQVGASIVRVANLAALDLLDSSLVNLEPAKLQRMRMKSADNSLTLEKKDNAWRVTESPAGAYPADAQVTAPLGFLWSNLRAERFADYGKNVDWKKYGLDKPAITVTAAAGKTEHTVELGKPVEGQPASRYARVNKGAGVAVLPPELTHLLTRTYLDYVNRNLLKFDAAAVASLQRRQGTNVLEVVKKDDAWELAKPKAEKADDRAMQQLLEQLGDLRADRIAAYPAKNLKEFGLDAPSSLVTIKLTGDKKPAEHVLKLGKTTGASGERFAVVDDGKAVAVLPESVAERLAGSPLTFRDRTIARFGDADRLQLQRGPRKAVFSKVDGSWKLTSPLQGDAEQDQLDDFLNSVARLRADALVAEKPAAADLKKYGLDRPLAQWRFQSGEKDVLNLLVGGKEEKSQRRYAKLANGDLVFLLAPALSKKVLDEYRPKTVWNPPLDAVQVESLNYRYPDKPFLLEKAESVWQAIGKPNAKINTAAVEDTLAALAGLKLDHYAVDKGANLALFGLDKPALILEVATRSGKRVLHLGHVEGNSKRRYARIPGADRTDIFVLDEETVARIARDLNAFGKPPARATSLPASR